MLFFVILIPVILFYCSFLKSILAFSPFLYNNLLDSTGCRCFAVSPLSRSGVHQIHWSSMGSATYARAPWSVSDDVWRSNHSHPPIYDWYTYLPIYIYIYMILHNIQPNVGRYAIYRCYGTFSWPKQNLFLLEGVLVGFGGWVLSCGILPKMAFLASPAENSRFGSFSSFGRAAKSPGTNIAIKNTSWWCGTVDPRHAAPVDMENIWIYSFFVRFHR